MLLCAMSESNLFQLLFWDDLSFPHFTWLSTQLTVQFIPGPPSLIWFSCLAVTSQRHLRPGYHQSQEPLLLQPRDWKQKRLLEAPHVAGCVEKMKMLSVSVVGTICKIHWLDKEQGDPPSLPRPRLDTEPLHSCIVKLQSLQCWLAS